MSDFNLYEEYNNKGFVVIKNLLNTNEINRCIKISKRYQNLYGSNSNTDFFPSFLRFFDPRIHIKFLKYLNLKFFFDSFFLISRVKKKNWLEMIKSMKKAKFNKVSRIDTYSSQKTNESITIWHTDQAFGGATHPAEFFGGAKGTVSTKNVNKLFIHITDVDYKNGCFAYIPFSHKVNLAIRKLINDGKIKYKPFLLLEDAIKIVETDHKDEILKLLSIDEINQFIINGKKALNDERDYIIKCNAGDAIIFNDFGYHKGTSPEKTDRIVFRYFYE